MTINENCGGPSEMFDCDTESDTLDWSDWSSDWLTYNLYLNMDDYEIKVMALNMDSSFDVVLNGLMTWTMTNY